MRVQIGDETRVHFDTSEVEGDLQRIADAFELGNVRRDEDAAALVHVVTDGTYLYSGADPFQFRLRWRPWAREAIQRVLG